MSNLLRDPSILPHKPESLGREVQPTFRLTSACSHPLPPRVHAYWEQKRGERRFPLRAEFDPTEIPQLLPYLMLVEVLREPLDFRYRLWGTELVYWLGTDPKGLRFEDLGISRPEAEALFDLHRQVAESGVPIYTCGSHVLRDGRARPFESVILPLGKGDDETVAFLLLGVGLYVS